MSYGASPAGYRARKKREFEARRERLRVDPGIIRHGTLNGYNNWGCRCSDCTDAYMGYKSLKATTQKPLGRKLPRGLAQIAAGQPQELADLIQEQYDDDHTQRSGYAKRLPVYGGEGGI